MDSLPFDAQRTINFFPILDEYGKEVAQLFGTPGLSLFGSVGTGPHRGNFTADNGRSFFVSGSELYEVDSVGNGTKRGDLNQSSGIVSYAESDLELAICDGETLYILNYATNVFQEVSDPDFPGASSVTYIDGYFIVSKPNTGEFYISAIRDGLSWNALDFATAEFSPDNLLRVYSALGQLFLIGDVTTEIWSNTGASEFPFQRISGALINIGTESPETVLEDDNSLFWVGKNKKGTGIVYRTEGFSPVRISTEAIESLLQAAPTPSELRAYAYQQKGHLFYVITGGGLETTPCYDTTTQLWHERAYLNSEGNFEQHLGSCCTLVNGKHLVGDRRNGNIYDMNLTTYSDNGDEIAAERIYTHISNEDERIRFNKLVVGVESGVGTQTGDDADPKISLRLSKDGARTWSTTYYKSIGAVGKYKTKVAWRRLGVTEQMTFRVRISSRVKKAITGSYLQ